MSAESNIELLKRAWTAYDKSDDEAFAACITDDWIRHGRAGAIFGFDDVRETLRRHQVAFSDMRTEMDHILADAVTVACHCTTSATHTGQYYDAPPSGKRLVRREMMFCRVRDGRVSETWAISAPPGFYEQITGRHAPPEPS